MKASKPQKKAHRPMAVVPILGKGHRHRSPKRLEQANLSQRNPQSSPRCGFFFFMGWKAPKSEPVNAESDSQKHEFPPYAFRKETNNSR
jgi:hypothetical protein